ncbi:wings apart-like protein homolog [Lineus longissimus]|uniref:wings apart-like protein homolog n=1 Tax=Lineus longissimus TaxID=88925 RepID=UPI00315C7367
MSRFSGKTYSRVRTRDTYSEKIFDDLFTDEEEKTGKPNATRAVGAHQKWGNIAVTSVRGQQKNDASENKRRKVDAVDTGPGDPFSFDSFSDEERPVGGKKKMASKATRGGVQAKSSTNNKKLMKFDGSDTNENQTKSRYNLSKSNRTVTGTSLRKDTKPSEVKSGPSNSKAADSVFVNQAKILPVSKATSVSAKPAALSISSPAPPVLKNASSRVQVPANKTNENKRQLSMDVFTTKSVDNSHKKTESSVVNEVFPSSQNSGDTEDIFSQATRTSSRSPLSIPTSFSSSQTQSSKDIPMPSSPDHTYYKNKLSCTDSETVNSCSTDNDFDIGFNFSGDTPEKSKPSPGKRSESQTPIERDHAYVSPIKLKENNSHKSVSSKFHPVASTSSDMPVLALSDSDSDVASVKSLPAELKDEKEVPKTKAREPSLLKKTGSTYGSRKILNSPKKPESKGLKRYNPRQWINKEASNESSEKDGAHSSQSQSSVTSSQKSSKSSLLGFDDFDDKPAELPALRRSVTWPKRQGDAPVSTLRVNKEHKQLFTVVRNVKEAHECQEHGETQEFFDDIEYLLAGLRDTQTVTTRCLSTLSLANKCIEAAFRMHLRAHGTVAKIFSALHDACCNPSLALSTSAIMYMMSRDRLNMDVDKDALELMIKLLSMDLQNEGKKKGTTARHETMNKELERMKTKVRAVIAQLKKDGGAKEIDLNEVTTGNLATETLLSLSSRRTGDWFKEEVRGLGGLDHIVDTVSDCTDNLDEDAIVLDDATIANLKKIDRCLRVLEHVTYLNSDNQAHLISYNSSALINSVCSLLKMLERILAFYPFKDGDEKDPKKNLVGRTVFNCMLSILKVLLNITHDNEWGSSKVGQHEGLLSSALMCALHCPQYAPGDERFDLLVLSLGMMINLVEHSEINRRLLVNLETVSYYDSPVNGDSKPSNSVEALDALIQLFVQKETAAGLLEESVSDPKCNSQSQSSQEKEKPKDGANESGEWEESDSGLLWVIGKKKTQDGEESDEEHIEIIPSSQEDEENFTKALHKAGKHMEDSIVAAYVALLIGCVVQENGALVTRVKDQLPDGSFEPMIGVLTKFLGFMNLTSAVGNTGGKSIIKVIETLMNS